MPQKTNLNISPYYDDYDKDNNFYKVLFKPGHPVQARELTTLQTMLQEQVSSFGSHIFKEGSMVIPGSLNYDPEYYSVKINADHQGVPVSLYADKLKGLRLTGQNSGVTVTVDNYALESSSVDITDLTLFVKYLGSGGDNQVKTLEDGEELIVEESFVYGNTSVNSGNTVATLISLGASAIGCAVGITTGIYFIRGTFVDVAQDKIVLDPYTNTPSYRVGLNINEEIVTAKDDDSLYDNARGYSNYAAPGADRLKISTVLSKKPLSDFNDKSFVELIKLDRGEIKRLQDKSQYSIIKDYFAKRTFEESGDYTVGNFGVEVKNSLNDGISNDGVFLSTQVTDQQNTPNDDLMCVKVSAGKAYVRGYDVDKGGTTVVDVDKPRDKRSVGSALVPFEMGSLIKVNNVSGSPVIGLSNNDAFVGLYSQRKASVSAANGQFIGQARVYAFNVSDAPYTGPETEWDLYLYDIQTLTKITFGTAIANVLCPVGSRIRGLKSGATGFITEVGGAGSTTVKKLSDTSGVFITGEEVIINEDSSLKRSLTVVEAWSIEDAKSVYYDCSSVSGISDDFVADVVLKEKDIKGWRLTDTATITSGGNVTSPTGADFTGLKVGDHVSYSVAGLSTVTYAEVNAVAANGSSATIIAVNDVLGVADGSLPGSTIESTFKVLRSKGISLDNGGLYAPIDSDNISNLNLSNSSLMIADQITGESTDGNGRLDSDVSQIGVSSSFFETFDAERYSVHLGDGSGSIQPLTSGDFNLQNGGGGLQIEGLTASQSNVIVNVTARKVGLRSKQKNFLRSQKVTIANTIVGVSTAITGLSTSQWYGTRVQDKEISLNVPDVANIVGIYESLNTSNPTFDRITFISGLGLSSNSILGERITGAESGAVAQITSRTSDTQVEIVYLNQNKFKVGEAATFEESNIVSNIQTVVLGNYLNITDGYILDNGQKEQFYDYSKIVRNDNFLSPQRRITVVYNSFEVPTNDQGDVYTVESYDAERYKDIPTLDNGIRLSDVIDFRPRVPKFTATDKSPFSHAARASWQSGGASLVPSPNESSLVGYDHYLPRLDKLVLDIDGNFSVIKGISAVDPKEPTNIEGAMDIALIHLPGYLFDPEDAVIRVRDNRRYTMRDIGKIEDRIENLEVTTSLSLLELDTKTLQVNDATGLSRFKTGFFVDDFKDVKLLDINNPDCTADIDGHKKEMNVPLHLYSFKPELALEESIDTSTADFSANLDLLDPNVQKTGDLITLKYEEVGWIEQPLASRVENVNPFNMIDFQGRVELRPESDSWVRDVYVSGGTRNETGDRDHEYIETIKISSHPDTHMRSRNVGFEAGGLKPVTRYYPFFDSTAGIDLVPKLLEITMSSGTFTIGETVEVWDVNDLVGIIRISAPNHKGGNINNISSTFNANPYNTSISLPGNYSASSTVLNIDIRSLTDDAQGQFWGYIPPATSTTLIGRSSGAQANVAAVRIVTDTYGDVGGSFWIRNPLGSPTPALRFSTGTKNFKLTSSSSNATPLPGSLLISSAETTYSSNGIVDTYRQTEVIVRRPPPPPPDPPGGGHRGGGKDPLAQSFTVDETGAFLTSVDLFFGSKDPSEKIVVEVRTVELGTPTDRVVADFARVTLEPSQVNISSTGETATRVTFPSPVYLQPREEYAIVLLSPSSDNYEAWVARMGERTVNTQSLPDAESVMVTRQYTGGSLFKSQNGTIWSPSQFEDLKFKLYKAKFTDNVGTVYFYNPSLGTNNNNIQRLLPNSVKTLPRKLNVRTTGITNNAGNSDLLNSILVPGRKVSEGAATATITRPIGYIENKGGSLGSVTITNGSSGYDPGSYTAAATRALTGSGTGATLNITVNAAGEVSAAAINGTGAGYVVGDVITVDNTTVQEIAGSGCEITVVTNDGFDTLYLTNVQGETFTTGQSLVYYDDAGTRVSLANTNIANTAAVVWPNNLYSGNVLEINQYNHGLGAANNKVSLANVSPDTVPELLTANLSTSDTTISVASTTPFATYQGITTDGGYVQINGEVIQYNSIGSGTLGIAARGIGGSLTRGHSTGNACYPYELNGIGLTAINTTFDLPSDTDLMNAKDIHKYHLQVTRPPDRASGDDMANFTDEQSLGESDIFASQNFQFNGVQPQFNVLTPGEQTSVSSKIRTVSGTSAGGSEVSFIDQGFEAIELNQMNKLDSTRIVCSQVNEDEHLDTLAKNKSTTLAIQFNSEDENLSPILDTATGSLILKRDLVNKPISNYVTDDRSNQLTGDPHSAVYISKKVNLKQPATSLQVLIGAYRHSSADFRVLYQLHRQGSEGVDQSYQLFPGYDNLKDTDGDGFGDTVINDTLDSGRPDATVGSSRDDEFREYQFSADNLDSFTGFSIKIVASGTNEAYAPRFKDLRVLALA